MQALRGSIGSIAKGCPSLHSFPKAKMQKERTTPFPRERGQSPGYGIPFEVHLMKASRHNDQGDRKQKERHEDGDLSQLRKIERREDLESQKKHYGKDHRLTSGCSAKKEVRIGAGNCPRQLQPKIRKAQGVHPLRQQEWAPGAMPNSIVQARRKTDS